MPARKIVVAIDLSRYSDTLGELDQHLGAEAARHLNHQIHSLIRVSLESSGTDLEQVPHTSTGDGAHVILERADDAHDFAEALHLACQIHNRSKDIDRARRHFRIGVWSDDVIIERQSTPGGEFIGYFIAGLAISNAVRLEEQCRTGEVLIGRQVWTDLSPERRGCYEREEWVRGKRSEKFLVHRRRVIEPAPWDVSPRPFRRLRRRSKAAIGWALLVIVTIAAAFGIYRMTSGSSTPPGLRPEEVASPALTNSLQMVMRRIAPGEFKMGTPPDEECHSAYEAQHRVRISHAFYMGETEVTRGQWRAVMGDPAPSADGDDLPVNEVSWYDAKRFCDALSEREKRAYRMPTEAEWEYACRAGTSSAFSFGPVLPTDKANFDSTEKYGNSAITPSRGIILPASALEANPWHLKNMHGNVAEWCLDPESDYNTIIEIVTDPRAVSTTTRSAESRAVRGGSFIAGAKVCRSGYRWFVPADMKVREIGFRVVLEAP